MDYQLSIDFAQSAPISHQDLRLENLTAIDNVCAILKDELNKYNYHQVTLLPWRSPLRFERAKKRGIV
jgi:hypothetical protein